MKTMRLMVGMGAFVLAATLTIAAQAPAGGGQGRGAPPAPPTNLQVLPKDIARPDLIAIMRGFNAGLGVECGYCHMDGPAPAPVDMASDDKMPKKTARVMLTMMMHANEAISSGVGKPAANVVKVECVT